LESWHTYINTLNLAGDINISLISEKMKIKSYPKGEF